MNANEVMANRAAELLGGRPRTNEVVHERPVNRGQSTTMFSDPTATGPCAGPSWVSRRSSCGGGIQEKADGLRRFERGRIHLQDPCGHDWTA